MRRLRGPRMRAEITHPTPLIEAHDLTVRLHGADQPILKDVDFTILPGEIVTVVGPNGSGKSTLVRAVLGHVAANRGGSPAARGCASVMCLNASMSMTASR